MDAGKISFSLEVFNYEILVQKILLTETFHASEIETNSLRSNRVLNFDKFEYREK
jgi:hypothetical protein